MNKWDVLLTLVLVAILGAAVWYLVRSHRQNKGFYGGCGDCGSCTSCGGCQFRPQPDKKTNP